MRHITHILHLFAQCPVQLPAEIVLPKSSLLEVAGVPTEDFFLSIEDFFLKFLPLIGPPPDRNALQLHYSQMA